VFISLTSAIIDRGDLLLKLMMKREHMSVLW